MTPITKNQINLPSFNNSINFKQAALVGGLAVAWMNPVSTLWYLSGAIGTVALYSLSKTAYDFYNKRCHRLSEPLLAKTDLEYEEALKPAFEELKKHPYYNLFKEKRNHQTDEQIYEFFKDILHEGYCLGSQIALLQELKQHSDATPSEILNHLKLKNVFYNQLLYTMLNCFKGVDISSRKEQENEIKEREKAFANRHPELPTKQRNAVFKKVRAMTPALRKMLFRPTTALESIKILNIIEKELMPWKQGVSPAVSIPEVPQTTQMTEDQAKILASKEFAKIMRIDPSFSVNESTQTYQVNLEILMKEKGIPLDAPIVGYVEICGDEKDRENEDYSGDHAIGFQCFPGKFRYYDTISNFSGGFYEYAEKNEFFEALKKQILSDFSSSKNAKIKFVIANVVVNF